MLPVIGLVLLFVAVFGGYALAGGKMEVIIAALPVEMTIIGGSAFAAFLIGNAMGIVKGAGAGVAKIFVGPRWKAKDYEDLLCLLYALVRTMRTKGIVAVEPHIEKPEESSLFQPYPRILADHFAVDLICDSIRMMSLNLEDPHKFEAVLDKRIEQHHHEAMHPAGALQGMSDALPALGIVAAVLGVIKTMGAINEPPAVLGKLIGSALVGTFLGVFLSYGMVGPIAHRLGQILDEEGTFYAVIKETLLAHVAGSSPQISLEIGRTAVPHDFQPSFAELEERLSQVQI